MYHQEIMKLTSAVLLFAAVSPALAQTKPAVHHTPAKSAAAKPAAKPAADPCGTDAQPTLPITVPKIAGCPKALYALRYIDTVVGTGAPVSPRKWLTVAYTGYLVDGTKFDSSIGKDPITFPYGAHQVIAGWDTGFEGMNIGGKRRLFIPYELAYGETGRPPVIPAKAQLVFDLELIAISDNPPAPKAPPTPPAGTAPATPATTPAPATAPGAGTKPAPDGAKPAAPAPTTDPTKPTTAPPPTTPKP
jgi:peptidylprolyl isomerase